MRAGLVVQVLAASAAIVAASVWLSRSSSRKPASPETANAGKVLATPSVTATVEPIRDINVAARVTITAQNAVEARVRYGTSINHEIETPWQKLPASGKLTTTIVALLPDAVTHIQAVVRGNHDSTASTGDLTVQTGAMPPGLPPKLDVTQMGPAPPGYVVLSINDRVIDRGFSAMVDRAGRVVWYQARDHRLGITARLPNGHFIVHRIDPGDFEEVDVDGSVVRSWRDPKTQEGTDGHEFRPLPNGHVFVIGQEIRTVDTRKIFPGGIAHALRFDQTATEVAPDHAVAWRWSTFSHMDESEITVDRGGPPFNPKDYEIAHLNSIEPTPEGNVIVSCRDTSTILKIDRNSGEVIWRLGGKKSDFRFVDDPLGGFSRQHDARLLENGNILLFDNGNLHMPSESRPVEYRLDLDTKTATMVFQHRRSPGLFARVVGSARRLPNGNTISAYGPTGVVLEVDPKSEPVWELRCPGGVYRADVSALYP